MKPFLSIIIPVYNGSLYLRETIESVLCQPCNDFELLLMDDGSTDGSLEICQSYEGDRVKVFSHANCGVSLTRNEGVERSGGQWIIFATKMTPCARTSIHQSVRRRCKSFCNAVWN